MTMNRLILSAALAALTISFPLSARGPRRIEFNAPAAGTVSSSACAAQCGTLALANNNLGAIVGFYTDTNSVPQAFLRTPGGSILSFEAPGAGLDQGTIAYSINDLGATAGYYVDASNVEHGFVRASDGTIIGYYLASNSVGHCFVRGSDDAVRTFGYPEAGAAWFCHAKNLNHGFLWHP